MPIVVNTNSAATTASFNLSKSNDALRKRLGRLSSGKRITSLADDAGGLAMDSDIAPATRFARHNVLVQAGAAMTAQANQLTNVALSLIG